MGLFYTLVEEFGPTAPNGRLVMPTKHRAGREPKKQKKKADKQPIISTPIISSSEVEVIKRKRKQKEEEL